MVMGFLKVYKSESQRVLLAQHSDLNFSKLEKLTPSDLAWLSSEEEAVKKSTAKQRHDLKVAGKKAAKKSTSEKPVNLNSGVQKLFMVYDIQALGSSALAPINVKLPLETETNV